MKKSLQITKLGWGGSCAVFVAAALLMVLQTRFVIPFLCAATGWETILSWFVVAGAGIFAPLIVTAWLLLRGEGRSILSRETWSERLRFRRITRRELLWGAGGLLVAGILSGLVMKMVELAAGSFDHSPPFMSFKPLGSGRYWLLAVWFPYWLLNIMGEELLWRGVLLPRQEVAFGRRAWILHGCGWGLFHAAFGWQLLLTLLPLIFVQSYVVQRTGNSWTGVLMHAGLNGPSFLAIAFGLL